MKLKDVIQLNEMAIAGKKGNWEAKKTTFSNLKNLAEKNVEGIVLLGAGGNHNEWVDGVTKILKKEKIAKSDDASKVFEDIYTVTTSGGRRDIVLTFKEPSDLHIGKMAMWRLAFGDCSWLSDYVVNYKKQFNEGQVDINILMSIDNIIRDGKVTNNLQNVQLCRMIEMLKYGNFQKLQNWNEVQTPAKIMEYVKALPSHEAVDLAKKFKDLLYVKDKDLLNKFYDPQLELAMWQRFVCSHQE